MVHFVGAGPGAPDLITMRGHKLLCEADVIIYAGSLVNPQVLSCKKESCMVYDSAYMTLEEVLQVMLDAEKKQLSCVRLHTGDASVYGAIREQMDVLREAGIAYDVTPGVSSFQGAAAALQMEYTLPGIAQSLILTRMEGRTKMPPLESIQSFAAHKSSMAIFLSAGMTAGLSAALQEGGYEANTPAAIVYKATWEDQKICCCTVGTLAETAEKNSISKTALILVGDAVGHGDAYRLQCELSGADYERSKLYDPTFATEFREASE